MYIYVQMRAGGGGGGGATACTPSSCLQESFDTFLGQLQEDDANESISQADVCVC